MRRDVSDPAGACAGLGDLAPDRPNKADKFARDGGDDDGLLFAACEHATIAGAQSDLCFPGNLANRGGNRIVAAASSPDRSSRSTIGPVSFDDEAACDEAAGFSDAGQLSADHS